MTKKLYLVLTVVVLALLFTACSRSASSSPVATSTKNALGTPGTQTSGGSGTGDPMALVKLFATQTAMAAGGQVGIGTSTPTGGTSMPGGTPITPQVSPMATLLLPSTGVPTTPPIITPYPTTTRPGTYTLQAGEFPFCLARRFNVDPTELMTLNGLTDNELLQPGRVLSIPQTGNTFPGTRALKTHPTTYLVVANDTIYNIGCYFGDVDPLAVAAVNHLGSPYTLSVGQSLSIP